MATTMKTKRESQTYRNGKGAIEQAYGQCIKQQAEQEGEDGGDRNFDQGKTREADEYETNQCTDQRMDTV